jgi:2-dehydropantoate 2-reductase
MGAGALGGYYGGLLARAGNDVTFIARGATLEALHRDGLQIRSKLSGDFSLPVQATDDIASLDPPELVFLSVKAYDLDAVAEAVAPIIGSATTVLTVQNGIDHPDRLARLIDRGRILPGVVYISSTVVEPGVIEQVGGSGRILIGELDGGSSTRAEHIRQALSAAGVPVDVHHDIHAPLWEKFMVICAMSGVTALTRLTLREIFDVPESRALYREVMAEVAAVARASGQELPDRAPDLAMEQVLSMPALPLRGSMAYDLMAGRRLELEALNGKVVELGERLGVPVPMNLAIHRALKPYAAGAVAE